MYSVPRSATGPRRGQRSSERQPFELSSRRRHCCRNHRNRRYRSCYTDTEMHENVHWRCGVGWYVWRPGGGVDGEEHVA